MQQPKNKSEQVNNKRIKSEPYHPTDVLANPNDTNPDGSQTSKSKGKVDEARPTPQALAKDKASYGADEHICSVEEQLQGDKDRYDFDIRLRLNEKQLRDVKPGT